MAASAVWKRHDTYPPLQSVLADSNGAISLATASQVKAVLKSTTTPTQVLVTGITTIASAAGGFVTYSWATNDLGVSDDYKVEYEIAWSAGGIMTVPNNGYGLITVLDDLENA